MKREDMSKLEKMLSGKEESDSQMSEEKMKIKKEMLEALMEHVKEAMKGRLLGDMGEMKKVSVMAPSQEGLEEGLEKAKEIVESSEMPEMEESEEKEEEMSSDPSPAMAEESPKEEALKKLWKDDEEEYSPFGKRRK